MNWSIEKVREIIEKDDRFSHGMYCTYYKLNDTVGLKMYHSIEVGVWCYLMQVFFERLGLAPETYGYVVWDGKIAILTEHIKIFGNTEMSQDKRKEFYLQRDKISEKVYDGIVPVDVHGYNCGLKNEEMIFADFSHFKYVNEHGLEFYSWSNAAEKYEGVREEYLQVMSHVNCNLSCKLSEASYNNIKNNALCEV